MEASYYIVGENYVYKVEKKDDKKRKCFYHLCFGRRK